MLHKFFVAISIVSVVADRPAVVVAVELVDVHSSIQATFWQQRFPAMTPWKEEWEPFGMAVAPRFIICGLWLALLTLLGAARCWCSKRP